MGGGKMNITAEMLEERYKLIEVRKVCDDIEVVDLYQSKDEKFVYRMKLIFAYNKLFTSGDTGAFTFGGNICHIKTFFKGERTNLGYWKEKVEASPRPVLCEEVDVDKVVSLIKKRFEEYEIEYDKDDSKLETGFFCHIDSNMYRAYDAVEEILKEHDVGDAWEVAGSIIDEARDWDGQYEYTCSVIQWVENNLEEWEKKYAV